MVIQVTIKLCMFHHLYFSRRYQWYKLSSKLPWFNFPPVQSLAELGVLFKDCCRRLWSIVCSDGGLYPKCVHCKVGWDILQSYK